MKLKPVKWRKRWLSDRSGYWEEASAGMFILASGSEAWLLKKAKEVAE